MWLFVGIAGLLMAALSGHPSPAPSDRLNTSSAESELWEPGERLRVRLTNGSSGCSGTVEVRLEASWEPACGALWDGRAAEHQSWRLTGGADACEGQVEVHFRGVWNTVCDSEWYTSEAKVLCQTLGCGTVVERPKGLPHSLAGRMYYSCNGEEPTLSNCSWRFNNSNLCSQSLAARVLCSAARSLRNLSIPGVPASVQPVTIESSATVKVENTDSRELMLLIPCIVLGILLLGSLISIAFILLRIKGKYALPVMVNHQHLPTTIPAGSNSYQAVPITIPKEEDSQRHRVTDEEVRQSRFQMPPLEEGLEELHASHVPAANPGHCITHLPSLGPQHHPRGNSESSTSSGEDYCNSPTSKPPPWNPQAFSPERHSFQEQPPNLELAGTQTAFSGSPSPQPDSTDNDDYDDIGAA
uniref:CD6 molecule n=1 Tax=Saimiri boliviensis boliviensis TaxID=39432 RepID=A0A2K6SC29_SAIBB